MKKYKKCILIVGVIYLIFFIFSLFFWMLDYEDSYLFMYMIASDSSKPIFGAYEMLFDYININIEVVDFVNAEDAFIYWFFMSHYLVLGFIQWLFVCILVQKLRDIKKG